MTVLYVKGMSTDAIKKFFSVLPVEKQPKVISDKDFPGIWDRTTSDGVTIIATEEPRSDTDIKELQLDGRQAEDVMAEVQPEGIEGSPAETAIPDAEEPKPEVKGYMTYRDRGFKVGEIQ